MSYHLSQSFVAIQNQNLSLKSNSWHKVIHGNGEVAQPVTVHMDFAEELEFNSQHLQPPVPPAPEVSDASGLLGHLYPYTYTLTQMHRHIHS